MKHQLFKNKHSNTFSEVIHEYKKHFYLRVFKFERPEPEVGYALWPKREFIKWHKRSALVGSEIINCPEKLSKHLGIFLLGMEFGNTVS